MTTTPGATPGSSDSSEPDNGDGPTTPPPSTSPTAPAPAATAPRIPEPSAPADSAPAGDQPQDAGPHDATTTDEHTDAERSHDAGSADEHTDEHHAEGTSGPQGAASPPGWAHHQPPPAAGGWARWTPPPGSRPKNVQPPRPPHQGGPRWGPAAGGQPGGPANAGATGTHSGWQPHQGWGTRIPEAKPGVVPLRPLGAGEILGGAIATLRLHWPRVIGYTAVVGAVIEAASALLQHRFENTSRLNDLANNPHATASDIAHALGGSMLASGLTLLVTLFGSVIVAALIATVVSRAVLGRRITSAELRGDIRSRLPQLLGLALLMPLLLCLTVGLGALPGILIALLGADGTGAALGILGGTAGAVVMMWLFIQLSLTPAVLMLEKQSVTEAVKRSWKLVSGAWWRVLGVQLLAVLVVTIATSVVELPFILIGEAASGNDSSGLLDSSAPLTWTYLTYVAVGGTIASAFTLPITAGTTTLLYLDQRIRRESLDLELIRASRNG